MLPTLLFPLASCLLTSWTFAASAGIPTAAVRHEETGFGNAVADAMRAAAGAELAWIAGGEFRDAVLENGMAPAAVAAALLDDPGDPLVVLQLTGERIHEALQLSLQQHPKPGKAFLHVSGIRVGFGPRGEGGRRRITVVGPEGSLGATRAYRVAMTRTLALGSYGYFRLWPDGKSVRSESKSVGEALQRHPLERVLRARGEGRMVLLTDPSDRP